MKTSKFLFFLILLAFSSSAISADPTSPFPTFNAWKNGEEFIEIDRPIGALSIIGGLKIDVYRNKRPSLGYRLDEKTKLRVRTSGRNGGMVYFQIERSF